MRCPFCKEDKDRVVDSRSSEGGAVTRRRRECLSCGRRYTSYERVEATPLKVVKKDGKRVPFERQKIAQGIEKACWNLPVSALRSSMESPRASPRSTTARSARPRWAIW